MKTLEKPTFKVAPWPERSDEHATPSIPEVKPRTDNITDVAQASRDLQYALGTRRRHEKGVEEANTATKSPEGILRQEYRIKKELERRSSGLKNYRASDFHPAMTPKLQYNEPTAYEKIDKKNNEVLSQIGELASRN